jgi:hypothetical protein
MKYFFLLIALICVFEPAHARKRPKRTKSKFLTDWESAAGLMYSNYNVNITNLTRTESGFKEAYVIDIDANFESGMGFILERRSIEDHSWGASIALEYFSERKLEKYKYNAYSPNPSQTGVTESCTAGVDCSYIQTTNLLLNVFYQWERFYIPMGFIYSLHKYKEDNYSSKINNSIGLNFGIGTKIDDRYLLEINSRAYQFEVDQTDSIGDNNKLKGIGTIVTLGVKVLF